MKKGFTLVEMLIVVVVLVTLMTITFKLGSISGSSKARTTTIARLQKLENCLSGYYAAFGTYPPVALHGSRSPYLRVSSHGIQNMDGDENTAIFTWDVDKFRRGSYDKIEDEAWQQVKAACKAQPVDCRFPFPDGYGDYVEAQSDLLKAEAQNSSSISEEKKKIFAAGFDDGVSKNIGRLGSYRSKTDWRDVQLFKFGLMSYLLPRYLVMMKNSERSLYEDYKQWTANNKLPRNPMTGDVFVNWGQVCNDSTSTKKSQLARVANIPSQAVCARWMPNLKNLVFTPHQMTVFGVDLRWEGGGGFSTDSEICSPGSFDDDSTSGQYMLDFCTVCDGWNEEFYYYSPAPHQSYTIWSAGPNKRTFPPWISREELGKSENERIGAWIEDDIVNMSH